MIQWSALKDFVLNFLFPRVCVSCKKEGDFLCAQCLASLSQKKIQPLPYRRAPAEEKSEFQSLDGVIYALDYAKNPQIRAALRQFKYRFTEELADIFGQLVSKKIAELQMTRNHPIVLIPIPLHQGRLNERGFNQAELVAQSVLKHLSSGIRAEIQPLLIRAQSTGQQAKLGRAERLENLKEAFEMNKNFVQSETLSRSCTLYFLIDDVCTTGATLENAARILKKNGIRKVYGLTLARSFRRFPEKQR